MLFDPGGIACAAMQLGLRAVDRRFGGHAVLSGVSCELPAGSSLAVTGPSGCGKSTLLHIAAGLDRPDGGAVLWDGEDIGGWSARRRERERLRRIGLLRQDPDLEARLSARDNVLLATAFRGVPAAAVRADELLARLGIDEPELPARHLSGGQAVRVSLARSLLARPALLIADEPSASLDPDGARRIADLLFELAAAENIGLLIATHDPELARRCAARCELGRP